jgi:hypothetical protein
MSKLSKNSIKNGKTLAFKLLAISAFMLLIIPFQVSADYGRNITFGDPNYRGPDSNVSDYTEVVNPKPVIYSISPKSADSGLNALTITITGKNFIPSSVARINGSNRPTNFIDSTHLLMQADGRDMYRTDGGFYVTVFNPAPGGGFSNAEFFKVNAVAIPNGSQNDTSFYPNPQTENFSSLTSNAIYGSNSFMPSGIVQWVLFAIIILLLVILARKLFGGEDHYMEAPMKHD